MQGRCRADRPCHACCRSGPTSPKKAVPVGAAASLISDEAHAPRAADLAELHSLQKTTKDRAGGCSPYSLLLVGGPISFPPLDVTSVRGLVLCGTMGLFEQFCAWLLLRPHPRPVCSP
jgi:hypothetical protein